MKNNNDVNVSSLVGFDLSLYVAIAMKLKELKLVTNSKPGNVVEQSIHYTDDDGVVKVFSPHNRSEDWATLIKLFTMSVDFIYNSDYEINCLNKECYSAMTLDESTYQLGNTPEEAICRAIISSKFGRVVNRQTCIYD